MTSAPNNPWRSLVGPLLVGMATFLLLALYWPATSSGLLVSTQLEFSLPKDANGIPNRDAIEVKKWISESVAGLLSGPSFESLIQQTKRTGEIFAQEIMDHDQSAIRNAIRMRVEVDSEGGRLHLAYQCAGHPDQLRFFRLIKHRLTSVVGSGTLGGDPRTGDSAGHPSKLDRAVWLASQLRADLAEVHLAVNQSRSGDQSNAGNSSSPFHLASSSKIDPEIANEINTQTVQSLNQILQELQTEVTSPGDIGSGWVDIIDVTGPRIRAVGATPNRFYLAALAAAGTLVAGFVAVFTADSGQTQKRLQSMSETLGIPVVAIVSNLKNEKSESTFSQNCAMVSRWLVDAAKVILLFALLAAICFCTIDAAIREAMFQNPFDGVAKILRVFFFYR